MQKETLLRSSLVLLALLGAFCGYGQQNTTTSTNNHSQSGAYFKTPWQDESQFIITAIASDLAEMAYYAKHKNLPEAQHFSVGATETTNSPSGAPVYVVEIHLDQSTPAIREELSIQGPIWSPDLYAGLVDHLFGAAGLTAHDLVLPGSRRDSLLSELTDLTARQLVRQDDAISEALNQQFCDASLHEQAALLLGAFMLREHSGEFFELRSPLCRLTAHLALARKLAGQTQPSLTGQVAKALLWTLMNNQKEAVEKLTALQGASPLAQPWVRALRARNTDDYRPLAAATNLTLLEKLEHFRAASGAIDEDISWNKLTDTEKTGIPDYARIVQTQHHSVQTGHQLRAVRLRGDLAELGGVYAALHDHPPKQAQLVQALNQMPERCFTLESKPRVRVLGWGQWAMFFQRHLCCTLYHDFEFINQQWGVPEEAAKFSQEAERLFSGLRLYPFVRRLNATEVKDYRRGVEDAFAVTAETPQLVPAQAWNYLCQPVRFAPLYRAVPNPYLSEWHKHNPPPGTAYNAPARLEQPSLVRQPDTVARVEHLHELAPWDEYIAYKLLMIKYREDPTPEQVEAVERLALEYDSRRAALLARVSEDQPAAYEKRMLQAAAINPYYYYELGSYFQSRDEAKAAGYLEKGMKLHPDSVKAANQSRWLVDYYQRHGLMAKATALADQAADTYSFGGLQAKARLLEAQGKYDEAFDLYSQLAERYNASTELTQFLARYKAKTGGTRYDKELNARVQKLFPDGVEKVTLSPGQGAPQDGVWFRTSNDLTRQAGLEFGDIIVAVNGIRIHNRQQYYYARECTATTEMSLVVWRKGTYLQLKASPPNHSFGVPFTEWPLATPGKR